MTSPTPGYVALPFKLAFRTEGKFINAYFAAKDENDHSHDVFLGSMMFHIANKFPDLYFDWQQIMAEVLSRFVKDQTGATPLLKRTESPPRKGGTA